MLFAKGVAPRITYTFKHALIQDSAYQLLMKKPRQQIHRRIAEAIETRFPDDRRDRPELLAHHFTEAGLDAQAVDYWLLAGQRSRDRSAHVEAIGHLTRGLDLIGTMAETPARDALELSFRLPLSSSSVAIRGYASPEVEEHNRRARALCEGLGGEAPLFHVMMVIWAVRFIQGRIAEAGVISRELIDLAGAGDDGIKAEAHWSAACNAWWAGDFADSAGHAERAIDFYQVGPSVEHAAFTSQNSGPLTRAYAALSAWCLGDPDLARLHAGRAIELAEQLRHPFTLVAASWHVGHLYDLAGDGASALVSAERVLALSREQAFAFWIGLGTGLKGAALGLLGRHREAIALLREGLTRIEATGCDKLHLHYQLRLAAASWAEGRRDEAWDALGRSFALNDRDRERCMEAEMHRTRGMFLADQGEPGPAEAALLRAVEVARSRQARFFELRAAADLARFLQRLGRSDAEATEPLRLALAGIEPDIEAPEIDRAQAILARTPD